MCDADPPHIGTPPPPGEAWCPLRLDLELQRWLAGHPMRCGTPHPVTLQEQA